MEYGYRVRYGNRKIKHAFLTGVIGIIIFIITAFGANLLYKKSAGEIYGNYEKVDVVVLEKIKSKPVRGRTKYYVHGKTEDGYEGTFWVRSELFEKLEKGDIFGIYKYKNYYGSTLNSLVSENAGIAYTVLYLAAIMAMPMGIIFIILGAVQKIKDDKF